ncbi:uncharacterized protein LOC142227255 [Haematobia irritans]|uniref:uncharacterized protein LOC142227255 n=1 Tax=Haematobia irritans TaxID=7368 RepID=UPI003F4FA6AA
MAHITINFAIFMVLAVLARGEIKVCPRFCKCDLYQNLNRAQCSSKNLISAEIEAPKIVQILDLSYNEIASIESTSFQKYYHVKYLNLSHNAIQTLDLDSFSQLKRILEIDLSYNRLEYMDERIFERNRRLININLEGNKFMTLETKPFLRSISLTTLNLRNSQLIFVHESLFSSLPNLNDLDLSQNLLNTFGVNDFLGLQNLKTLNLSGNSFKCTPPIKENVQLLRGQGLNVVIDQCQEDSAEIIAPIESFRNNEKFQKMTLLEEVEEPQPDFLKQWHLTLDSEEDLDEQEDSSEITDSFLASSEWLRFAPDAVLCDSQKFKLCQSYRKCLGNLNTAWHEKRALDTFTSSEAKFSFFLGAACGITLVICILTCALCLKNCCASKKRDRFPEIEEQHEEGIGTQPLARQNLPPQSRRPVRRRAPHPPNRTAMVRYEGPVGENFLSRLFGRPARSQYYRTINQNTATLIRRLSRSNLFNNRLSQHFADRQNSNETSSPEPQECLPSAPRPETPPPCYGDVVVNGCDEHEK